MASKKFRNIWDDTLTVAGSVYVTPVYPSGLESGLPIRTAPGTLHFTPDVGAPARHMNYALFTLGDDKVKDLQHKGAGEFRGSGNWPGGNVKSACFSRTDRGFIIGTTTSVSVVRDGVAGHALNILAPAVGIPMAVLDDGVRVWEFESTGNTRYAASSTALSGTALSSFTPLAARQGQTAAMILGTTGTALNCYSLSGTAFTPVANPAGVFSSSTLSLWSGAQAQLDSSTATGPIVFASRDSLSDHLLYSPDGAALASTPHPASTRKTAGVAYDDVQSQFVLATYSATGSALSFYTSPDATTWTLSTTATGPANLQVPSGAADGTVAFDICCGVWFVAISSNAPPNFIYGQSGANGKQTFGYYSLDYGVTWYPSDLQLANMSGSAVHLRHSENRFLVWHDSDLAVSGRLGYNTTL